MKVGIITFHGAHNYGAVLQAYALQQYILSKGAQCEIIDFRSESQKDFNNLYPKRNGFRSIIKNILMLPYDKLRRVRYRKFEEFIHKDLVLTPKNYSVESFLYELNKCFDVFITGSDQVWNTRKKADVSNAYFLSFVENSKKKIAYAASIGNAKDTDLVDYVQFMKRFDNISCRELGAALIVSDLLNTEISTVLDPTLLVNSNVFNSITANDKPIKENYILYYSLDGYDKRKNNVYELRMLSKYLGMKIIAITPEWPKKEKDFCNIIDAGPIEFLNLIKYADLVCTNSFHGTALSLSFGKDFFVLDTYDGIDERKINILRQLNLEDRMTQDFDMLMRLSKEKINYSHINKTLNELRNVSKFYINKYI